MAFNVLLASASSACSVPSPGLLEKLFPRAKDAADPASPRYLDESGARHALAGAGGCSRETLRMGDVVEVMLRPGLRALMTNDRALAREVSRMTTWSTSWTRPSSSTSPRLTRGSLDDREGHRANGDHLLHHQPGARSGETSFDKNLAELAGQEDQAQAAVLSEGAEELAAFTSASWRACASRSACSCPATVKEARKLIADKALLRNAELAAPSGISSACVRAGRRRWRRRRYTRRAARPQAHPLQSARSHIRCSRPRREMSAADAAGSDPHHRRGRQPQADGQ